jgi:hypothetical protein
VNVGNVACARETLRRFALFFLTKDRATYFRFSFSAPRAQATLSTKGQQALVLYIYLARASDIVDKRIHHPASREIAA